MTRKAQPQTNMDNVTEPEDPTMDVAAEEERIAKEKAEKRAAKRAEADELVEKMKTIQAAQAEQAKQSAVPVTESVTTNDDDLFMTVNEKRSKMGLGPLMLADGKPNPDGDMTVAEFKAKRMPQAASTVVPSAITKKQYPDNTRWFRVLATCEAGDKGTRFVLRAGKEINSRNYDIRSLRKQGVQLEDITNDVQEN